MHNKLDIIVQNLFHPLGLVVDNFSADDLNSNYLACNFEINKLSCVFREAKLTPKKLGNFVALWKRPLNGEKHLAVTIPHDATDFEFCFIFVEKDAFLGIFIFPSLILQEKNIISNGKINSGRRGFRLYPNWDILTSKQALSTQKWQLDYFINLTDDKENNINKFKNIINWK